jgi:hypothetical protein
VVEPIRRRPRTSPQSPSPSDWTAPGRRGIKGWQSGPHRRCASKARGLDANQTTRAFLLSASFNPSITEAAHLATARAHAGIAPRDTARNTKIKEQSWKEEWGREPDPAGQLKGSRSARHPQNYAVSDHRSHTSATRTFFPSAASVARRMGAISPHAQR